MDFRKTEEQELLLESVRELMAKFPQSYWAECDANDRWPIEFKKALADNGFQLLGVPEEFGGTEVDVLTHMLVTEEFNRLGMPPYLYGSESMKIDDMLAFGSKEQQTITMDLIKEGKFSFSLGITEPQAGSDNSSLTTTATRKNGKVYINGHKTFVTAAAQAPYMVTVTKDSEPNKFSMWWVPMDAPGVKVEPLKKIGWNPVKTCEVYLNNVEIEEKDLVGVEGKGFIQLLKNFEIERLNMCAFLLGMSECAFEDAASYANQRIQFGKKIGEFQLIQLKLVDMKIKIENMRNYLYRLAWEKDNGISVQLSSALCKRYCAISAFEVVDDAMQILGGIGYTEDHRIARIWRDIRAYRIAGGTDEIMVYTAGKQILKQFNKK